MRRRFLLRDGQAFQGDTHDATEGYAAYLEQTLFFAAKAVHSELLKRGLCVAMDIPMTSIAVHSIPRQGWAIAGLWDSPETFILAHEQMLNDEEKGDFPTKFV